MDSGIISGAVGGAISVVLVTYVSARVRNRTTDGTLRYGWWLTLFGWIFVSGAAIGVWALLFDDVIHENALAMILIIGMIIGFCVPATYAFGEYFLVHGKCDDQGIEFYTPWTGRKVEKWHDLETATFNPKLSSYVLTFRSGGTIRLSNMLSGHGVVVDKLKEMGHALD